MGQIGTVTEYAGGHYFESTFEAKASSDVYTPGSNEILTEFYIRLQFSGTIGLYVFRDSDGVVLGSTQITVSGANGWESVTGLSIPLASGVGVRIGFANEGASGITLRRQNTASAYEQASGAAFPDPWSGSNHNYDYSFYANTAAAPAGATLTSPTGVATGGTTASGTVTTDQATGTLHYYASTNSTESAATIKASGQSQAVSASGIQNVSLTGLSSVPQLYIHYIHNNGSDDSNVASSAAFSTERTVTGITGDVKPGGTFTINTTNLDANPTTQIASFLRTTGGTPVPITVDSWSSSAVQCSIAADAALRWGALYTLTIEDDTGSINIDDVPVVEPDGWEFVQFNGVVPDPVSTESFREYISLEVGDLLAWETQTGMSVDTDTIISVIPPATVTGQFKKWVESAQAWGVASTFTFTDGGVLGAISDGVGVVGYRNGNDANLTTAHVWIIMGQSNAEGQANDSNSVEPDPVANAQIWKRATDFENGEGSWLPLSGDNARYSNSHWFGPEISMGNRAVAEYFRAGQDAVYFIKAAVGATSLKNDWDKQAQTVYKHMIVGHVRAGLQNLIDDASIGSIIVHGVHWDQGEADAEIEAWSLEYRDNFNTFKTNFEGDTGLTGVPWALRRLPSDLPSPKNYEANVIAAQQAIADANEGIHLLTANYSRKVDNVHLDAAGAIAVGNDAFDAMIAINTKRNLQVYRKVWSPNGAGYYQAPAWTPTGNFKIRYKVMTTDVISDEWHVTLTSTASNNQVFGTGMTTGAASQIRLFSRDDSNSADPTLYTADVTDNELHQLEVSVIDGTVTMTVDGADPVTANYAVDNVTFNTVGIGALIRTSVAQPSNASFLCDVELIDLATPTNSKFYPLDGGEDDPTSTGVDGTDYTYHLVDANGDLTATSTINSTLAYDASETAFALSTLNDAGLPPLVGVLFDVGATFDSEWGLRTEVLQSVDSEWHIREFVDQTFDSAWGLRDWVQQSYDSSYHVREFVSGSFQTTWDLRVLVQNSFLSEYDLRVLVGDSFTSEWILTSYVSQTFESSWLYFGSVRKEIVSMWHIDEPLPPYALQTFDSQWDIKVASDTATRIFKSTWNNRVGVQAVFNSSWNLVQGTIGTDLGSPRRTMVILPEDRMMRNL